MRLTLDSVIKHLEEAQTLEPAAIFAEFGLDYSERYAIVASMADKAFGELVVVADELVGLGIVTGLALAKGAAEPFKCGYCGCKCGTADSNYASDKPGACGCGQSEFAGDA